MTTVVRALPLILVSACALAGDPGSETAQALSGNASVSLHSAAASISQTSTTSWSLAKTGSVDTSTKTVRWQITATQGSTVGGRIHLTGSLNVTNTGSGGATIGNIVVNLQSRQGNTWITRSSDVNDATSGDAATTAKIFAQASSENRTQFTENGASGPLQFTDANTNTLFSLVPEVTIPPGATVPLKFDATFDNTVLHLADGTAVRAEIIVSFGNHGPHGNAGANIDINGNGVIDADEAYVRSVPARLGFNVPAQQPGTTNVTLADALADISTTGTVTVSSPSFNIGATSGTVTVHYDGGTDGGDITNCAHLTSSDGLNLQACNTQSVTGSGGGTGCTDGAPGCGWKDGDLTTYNQAAWTLLPAATATLVNNYFSVYASTFGILEIGIAGSTGFSIQFTSADAINNFIPTNGGPAALSADLVDPVTTAAGVFAGDVLALQLDIDYSDRGLLAGTTGLRVGDLTLCGLTGATASLDGTSVRSFAALANTALGGGSTGYSITDLDNLAGQITNAFNNGVVSSFAQTSLVNGACP
jgi:hypothetical protein